MGRGIRLWAFKPELTIEKSILKKHQFYSNKTVHKCAICSTPSARSPQAASAHAANSPQRNTQPTGKFPQAKKKKMKWNSRKLTVLENFMMKRKKGLVHHKEKHHTVLCVVFLFS